MLGVHRAEQLADHLVRVGRVPRAHLLDGGGEQAAAVEDVGVLGEEAEDQPGHEVVHVRAALGRAPVGVVLQQLDVEPVQPAGGPDVERVLADLPDGGDARQRQEEAEVVREIGVGAGDGLAARRGPRPRTSSPSVARMNLALACAVAGLACSAASVSATSPGAADRDVDVVALEHAAEVGLVRCRPCAAA